MIGWQPLCIILINDLGFILQNLLVSITRHKIFLLLLFCHSDRNPLCLLSWFLYQALLTKIHAANGVDFGFAQVINVLVVPV